MTGPEDSNWPEFDASAEFASQEDVSLAMQAIEENVKRFGVKSMGEDGLLVAETPQVHGGIPDGHILYRATVGSSNIARLQPAFHRDWRVGEKIEFQWQSAHDIVPPNDPLAEPTHVPDTATVLIHRELNDVDPEEFIIMQRRFEDFDFRYTVDRIMADEQGNPTQGLPLDTPTETALIVPVTGKEVEELEAIAHALPMLLRPPRPTN